MNKLLLSYAQNREDLIIEAFFPDVTSGVYVDVGANHPIKHSVTKLLYQKGWRGIHLEPNESLCSLLRFDRPEDIVLNVGASDEEGILLFTEYANHGLSTFSNTMREEYKGTSSVFTDTFREYEVPVQTLARIFSEQSVKHIHFMKIDVEGFEYEVIRGNDWGRYRPEMICIEANHIIRDWRVLLKEKGYTKVFNDGLNNYYLAEESKERLKNFSYAKSLLESGEVVTLPVEQAILLAGKEKELTELRVREVVEQLARVEHQNNWYENAPFTWLAKKTMRAFDRAIVSRVTSKPPAAPAFNTTAEGAGDDASASEAVDRLVQSYRTSVLPPAHPKPGAKRILLLTLWPVYRVLRKVLRLLKKLLRGTK